MKKRINGTLFVCCLVLSACGTDNNDKNNATNNNTSNGNNATSTGTNNGTTTGSNNGTSTATNNGTGSNNGMSTGGELTNGDDCSAGDVCMGGLCTLKATDPCDGVCVDFLETGASCAMGEGLCDPAADECDFGDTNTCIVIVRIAKGAACTTGECESGLFCKKTEDGGAMGACSDPIAIGGSCEFGATCITNAVCVNDTCLEMNLDLGEDCTATPSLCKFPNYCDNGGTGKCVAPAPPVSCD